MANKKTSYYERQLRLKIEQQTGSAFEEWLTPQLHAAALCWQMLEKVHDELMTGKLIENVQGSKEQWKKELNPLVPTYKELHETLIKHYKALGLSYESAAMKTSRRRRDDDDDQEEKTDESVPLVAAISRQKRDLDTIPDFM